MDLHWPDSTATLTQAERDLLYPVDDDEPMTSSLPHCDAFVYALAAVRTHLWDVDWLMPGDFAVYYEPLPPGAPGPGPAVVPDLQVIVGTPLDGNTSYCLWEVGKVPALALEMTPKYPQAMDPVHQHALYAWLGVPEYWLYDPHGDYLASRLQGWQLVDGHYRPIPGQWQPALEAVLFPSAVLDTSWGYLRESGDLRLWNPREKTWYLPHAAAQARRMTQARRAAAQVCWEAAAEAQAQARRETTIQACRETEAEGARLRALLKDQAQGH